MPQEDQDLNVIALANSPLRDRLEYIVNSGDHSVADHAPMIEGLKASHNHNIESANLRTTAPYNCFAHALGVIESRAVLDRLVADANRAAPIGVKCGIQFIVRLLKKRRLVPSLDGPVVLYFRDGGPVHAGLVRNERVVSKWGSGLLWSHDIAEVPSSYGIECRRYVQPALPATEREFGNYVAELEEASVNQKIWSMAWAHLRLLPGITDDIIAAELVFPENNRPQSKLALFRAMVEHAKNRRHLPKVIGDIDVLRDLLFDFDADQVLANFAGWEQLFDCIKGAGVVTGQMPKDGKNNSWVTITKAILSIAAFVTRFETIEEFHTYVDRFVTDSADTRMALPLLLAQEISGYGFALGCDFLKENISPEFVKPDIHIRDIFVGIGRSQDGASDFQLFRDVVHFANSIGQPPYAVDKIFWTIGTGNFYNSGIGRRSNKKAFILQVREALAVPAATSGTNAESG